MVARTLDGGGIDGALGRPALLDEDAGTHDAVPPCDGLAIGVERGPEDVVRRRAVEAVLDVVLARPDDFHGRADGLRGLDGVGDEVGLAAPSEATAEQRRHHLHALHRHAGDLRGQRLVPARVLRRRPERDAVRHDVRGGVHRPMQACSRNGTWYTASTTLPPAPSACSALPSLRATWPGCLDIASYCVLIAALVSEAMAPSSHVTLSARRPCSADQKLVATTATPLLTCTTCLTPGTAFAAVASRDCTLPLKTGQRSIEAMSMPGTFTSMP